MNLEIVENLAARGVKGDFKFTSADSFRLFVEGMGALRRYERLASPESLDSAERNLEDCVARFPLDVLPQFYLGVVRAFRSYSGAPDAIHLFKSIVERSVPQLRAAALYNLAGAHIELYTSQTFEKAKEALGACIAELGKARSTEQKSLQLQAKVLLLYCKVHQQLWEKRRFPTEELQVQIKETAPKLQAELESLRHEAEKASIPSEAQADVLADYWNTRGTVEEFLAWQCGDPLEREKIAESSVQSFKRALGWKLNWIPAKSNLARVYQDLLSDYDSAIRCWREVLDIRPDDNYAEYELGRMYTQRGEYAEAASHYERARYIKSARKDLARIYAEKLNRPEDALKLWEEILKESPRDGEVRRNLARLLGDKLNRREDALQLWCAILLESPFDAEAVKVFVWALPAIRASDAELTA